MVGGVKKEGEEEAKQDVDCSVGEEVRCFRLRVEEFVEKRDTTY